MYKHILFDADNTLLDFDTAERNAFAQTMQHHSVPWDEALLSRYSSINKQLWLDFEQGHVDKETVQLRRFEMLLSSMELSSTDVNRTFQENLSAQISLMPYAQEVCEHLSQHAKLSIVTNGVGATQHNKMMRSGLRPYFHHLFISEEIGFPKPDPRFFAHVLDTIGKPECASVLIIGDSLTSDIQGGMNAGIATCWFNPRKEPLPPGYRVDYVIEDLRELEKIAALPPRENALKEAFSDGILKGLVP